MYIEIEDIGCPMGICATTWYNRNYGYGRARIIAIAFILCSDAISDQDFAALTCELLWVEA